MNEMCLALHLPGYLWHLFLPLLSQKIPELVTGRPVTVTNGLVEARPCLRVHFPPCTQTLLDITQAAFILGRLFIMAM